MPDRYNDPAGGVPSSVGSQIRTDYMIRSALTDLKAERYFGQLASTISMPKNFGKKLIRYHYLPVLDDRNLNDQGIDAAGVVLSPARWYAMMGGAAVLNTAGYATQNLAEVAIRDGAAATRTAVATLGAGNLGGSSKDVGKITSRMPLLSENGGDVNGVSNRRVTIEGTFEKYGIHNKFTKESLDFDTDAELEQHTYRELMRAAEQVNERQLQQDLLAASAVHIFAGDATTIATVNGRDSNPCLIDYADLSRLSTMLNDNRCPKDTKMITGTKITDTRTAPAARFMYIGSELISTIRRMKDFHDEPAFIPAHQYAAGAAVAVGEIGMVDSFKIIVVPEMQVYEGQGAVVTTNAGNFKTTSKLNASGTGRAEHFDVFPMLVVGSDSFSTIGFQTGGKTVKFKIKRSMPESTESYSRDYFGESGFTSIKWYYGTIIFRSEWIATAYTVATV